MKKLMLILTVALIAVTGCKDESKNLSEKHQTLLKESDSIMQVYTQFQDTHTDMLEKHRNLTAQVESSGIMDADIMEKIATNEVIIERHAAMLESHKMMLESHMELKDNFEDMDLIEMRAQIEQMRQNHDQIMSEQETMRQEHEQITEDHEAILQKLDDFQTANS
ncbi:MAG: hypothetical protein ACQEQB_07905 [Bacteroidota bacterium]